MLLPAFIQWWYGPGWFDMARRFQSHLRDTYLSFSVATLLGTLFAPWRRIITPPGGSLQQRLSAYVDNIVSRFVGFMVRIITLLTAGIVLLGILVGGGLLLALWPLMPILGPVLIIGGLI